MNNDELFGQYMTQETNAAAAIILQNKDGHVDMHHDNQPMPWESHTDEHTDMSY